jgi:hypothetical protein
MPVSPGAPPGIDFRQDDARRFTGFGEDFAPRADNQ